MQIFSDLAAITGAILVIGYLTYCIKVNENPLFYEEDYDDEH